MENNNRRKLGTYQICLIALAIVMNVIGGQIALALRLPIYLDSIGTYHDRCHAWTMVRLNSWSAWWSDHGFYW